MTTTDTAPGLTLPTKQGMLGSNPRESAHLQNVHTANKAQNLKNAVGGTRMKLRKKQGGGIEAPQYHNPGYTPQNGPGQDPNSQIKAGSTTSTQQHANAVYDKQAMSGGRKLKNGGESWSYNNNPDWNWKCMSGGKKTLKRKSRKNKFLKRKSRKNKSLKRKSRKNKSRKNKSRKINL